MRLPRSGRAYDAAADDRKSQIIEAADRSNHKRGQDVEVGAARLILTAPNGTRYSVSVSNAGAIVVTSI